MRPLRVLVAMALAASLSGSAALLAASAGQVSGVAVDATGNPLAGIRVELLDAGAGRSPDALLQVNVTDGRGSWAFNSVPAGDYVVRILLDDQVAGVPVSVAAAEGMEGVRIVAPSLPSLNRSSQGAAAVGGSLYQTMLPWVFGAVGTAFVASQVGLVVTEDKS